MKPPYAVVDISIPDKVVDEEGAFTVPTGETAYHLVLTDAEVELLATGVVPEAISRRAFTMLAWKRESQRMLARDVATGDRRRKA